MLRMFDFSKIEDTSLKSDLQNVSSHLLRADQVTKNPQAAEAQVAANWDAFLMISQEQLQYYNKDGTPRVWMVNFGDEMTLNSNEDNATIWMEDSISTHVDSFNQTEKMDTVVHSGHSVTWEWNSVQKFNHELSQIKDQHCQEMKKAQCNLEELWQAMMAKFDAVKLKQLSRDNCRPGTYNWFLWAF